jgi:FAD synthase
LTNSPQRDIIQIQKREQKEITKMTKKIELINKIEATGMMINFNRELMMTKDEKYLEWAYKKCLSCVSYCEKHGIVR